MKTIAFFNSAGKLGKTTLAYHLAWMYADLGIKVVVADFDPQANLTSLFLEEDRLEDLWPNYEHPDTILGALGPVLRGDGEVAPRHVEDIADNIGLVVGDPGLALFEDTLAEAWWRDLDKPDRDESLLRVTTAFFQVLQHASSEREADLTLVDLGPNLTAINRAALIAADYVAVPVAPEITSLEGLQNLGQTLRGWRSGWAKRRAGDPSPALALPAGRISGLGYVLMQRAIRFDRPVQMVGRWMSRIPGAYRSALLDPEAALASSGVSDDPECLAQIREYFTLMPMAHDARKPMFFLKPADGAIGAHAGAVTQCYRDFRTLAKSIARRIEIQIR